MVAMLYLENADIIGTYESWDEARDELVAFVHEHPAIARDVGLRAFEDGLPSGEFVLASQLLQSDTEQLAQ
jgi:hypothetical protein